MNAIVSVTRDWGIGRVGKLIVRNRADMRRFVALTTGGTVVMGRTTFESFPNGPLKGRRNVVLTRSESWSHEGVDVAHSDAEALEAVAGEDPASVWLIGGESVYRLLLDECERVYVTKNDVAAEADAYFPNLDESEAWEVESREEGGVTEGGVPFEFVTYARKCDGAQSVKGKEALEALAQRFPQLYVAPAEDALDAYKAAAGRGRAPEGANLDHFIGNAEDELRRVPTPAGPIETLFLKERQDFETFLRIIGHKSQPVPIARTVGAITYCGLADWGKVAEAYMAYTAQGGDDWGAEFARLAKVPGAFRSEIIVISEGPYSNVSADKTPYGEDEWVRVSRGIRLHHECAHVVCRRTMPKDILPIWDEITADVVGLLCATGSYDARLAATFLGVGEGGFAGGRLSEYLSDEQLERIDDVSKEVFGVLCELEKLSRTDVRKDPFTWLLDLKREPLLGY